MSVGRLLIYAGAGLLVLGVLWMAAERMGIGFGRLPGDLSWRGKGWSVHFPIVTSIVLSVVLTVLINLFRR